MTPGIPPSFHDAVARRRRDRPGAPSGERWLDDLPALIEERLAAWDLALDGPPWNGQCALVLPARRRSGEAVALKLTWPHEEARTEHIALRLWDGDGAVRLLAAEPSRWTLLLERLDGDRDLERVDLLGACEELGRLFTRLDRPASPQIPRLSAQLPRWRDALSSPSSQVPRRLQQQALSHLADLEDGVRERLIHADLHFGNALAPRDPERGAWLAIDPKPLAGEWAYAVAPAIWNREQETARAHSASVHVRLRADVIADAAGLDPDRVRMWTFVRLVLNAVDAASEGRSADPFRARSIALAAAFASP